MIMVWEHRKMKQKLAIGIVKELKRMTGWLNTI